MLERLLVYHFISLIKLFEILWILKRIYSPSINRTAISVAKQMIKETRPIKAD